MAWNHQFLDPTGRVKPCCRFEERHRPPGHSLESAELSDLFWGPWMNQIREQMLAGQRVDGCRRCYEEEDSGKKSLRQRYNTSEMLPIDELVDVERPHIRWIELAISNSCNLACRMCDSRYSLKWFNEEKSLWGKTFNKRRVSQMDINTINPFLDELVHLKFTGGEPLITPDHWRLVKKLVAEHDSAKILLNYSTNCTIFPKPEWIELWGQFKFVEFALSFDSADPLESEYIRWPSQFTDTEKTTRAFIELGKKSGFKSFLRTTTSILNIWHLPETILWWIENCGQENPTINPTHLTHPNYLSITVLPEPLKRRVEHKFVGFIDRGVPDKMKNCLQHMINHMNSVDNSHLLEAFRSYIEKTDSYRNQSFRDHYPHFASLL